MSLLRRLIAPFLPAPRVSTDAEILEVERVIALDPLAAAGEAALQEALRLWRFDIIDPRHDATGANADRCRAAILDIIQTGGGWDWVDEYRGDGARNNPQWCGFTAGYAWRAAIPEAMRRDWWASCYRLDHWGSYRDMTIGKKLYQADERPSEDARLFVKLDETSTKLPFTPRAGDILVVGNEEPKWGDHIELVERYDADERMFFTVGGNAMGVGPTGERRQGVVRAKRPLGARKGHSYIARRLIRPAVTDLL
jgi:hypothetical protein